MTKRPKLDFYSLPAQMILSFVALVLLTATAIGLPAIWLIREQLARQAWAQVEQGRRATRALYEARQSEIRGLATLSAQRPTLRELLTGADKKALQAYLYTLQTGAGLDLMLICDPSQRPVTQAGNLIADELCTTGTDGGFYVIPTDQVPQVWLSAAHPIDGGGENVVVAVLLDQAFAIQMRDQTGLEHTLLVAGKPVATSLAGGTLSRLSHRTTRSAVVEGDTRVTFDLNNSPYYATLLSLDQAGLEAEVALAVAGVAATQRRLAWTLATGIVAIAALGSAVGALLARRIGQPLDRLADIATALSSGDLSNPVTIKARVREVALVAQALEGARTDLRLTLDQLRQEKAWTDHLLQAIVEGIVTLDHHGRITFFSHGAERITGWKRDQVLGHTCDEVFRTLERDEPFSQLIPAPDRRHKITVELHDGREAILSVTGARLLPSESGDARVALVFRDVSEEEAVHRLLGHFLANVAHEFRTPLAAVAASVELLLDQAPDLSAAEMDELLVSLHLGVLGLQTLVDNLLESASIEAGHFRVSPRPSDLDGIIAEAIRTTQPLLDKHGQRLVVELPAAIPVVRADPRRTVQVLVNLLSNASKYGPDRAEISISAALSPDGDRVRVSVADRGPGIPPEYHCDLFRRFMHLSLNDKAQYGAGLGLSVVKAVVEAHSGQVGVEDRLGGGATFWFTLPQVREK